MSKGYDPAYILEVCKAVDSGSATVPKKSRETGINEIHWSALAGNYMPPAIQRFCENENAASTVAYILIVLYAGFALLHRNGLQLFPNNCTGCSYLSKCFDKDE